jgi:ketosteroid isomerase-like protein
VYGNLLQTASQENVMTKAREAIAEGYKAFEMAFCKGDADTISRMYTEDAELLIPEAPTVSGREAIAQVWESIVGSGGNTVRVNTGEVQESGDWAYEVGTFKASAPDGKVLNAGKYIVIWKRESTGEWKIHRDIFNWDIPPAQASTP